MAPDENTLRNRNSATWAVYGRYAAILRRYLRQRLRNREDVRELAQEVWVRLLWVDDPNRVLNPRAYLYKVAGNVVAEFQHLRQRDPVSFDSEVFESTAESEECASFDDSAEALDRQGEVYRLLQALSATYRQIVLLRICEGATFAAIGEKLGLSAATAERYCQSALTQIRRNYGRDR